MNFVLVRQKNKTFFNQAVSVIFANSYKLLLETPGGISEETPKLFCNIGRYVAETFAKHRPSRATLFYKDVVYNIGSQQRICNFCLSFKNYELIKYIE